MAKSNPFHQLLKAQAPPNQAAMVVSKSGGGGVAITPVLRIASL